MDVNVGVMINSWEVLYPPPSLRDTSASGGYGVTLFAITIQFLSRLRCRYDDYWTFDENIKIKLDKRFAGL